MSDNKPKQPKDEAGHRFGQQNIPAGDHVKREHGGFADGIKHVQPHKPAAAQTQAVKSASISTQRVLAPIDKQFEIQRLLILLVVGIPLGIWASLPAWTEICSAWYNSIDYGHGFLVLPLVAYFLYVRKDTYPGTRYSLDWLGLFPIMIYAVMRAVAGMQYYDFIEQTSIFFWILGFVWFFYGTKVFIWAFPTLCFLVFMFQLPFIVETAMRHYLQAFAAHFASVLLNILNEPAIPIKNTIRLSKMELGVEQACSGLRFLMSILAISFATVLLFRRPWWQNVLIVVIAVPLALFVNACRIALTGILLMHCNSFVAWLAKEGQNPSAAADEFSGLIFIFVALALFGLFVWYLGKVFRKEAV